MLLMDIAEIIQGNIPTRIESSEGIDIEIITMQELNYVTNISDDLPAIKYIKVQSKKNGRYSLTKENDIVIGLNSCKAMVISTLRANKIVLSNLATIRITDTALADPNYICWYLNKNTNAIKKFRQLQQGTHAVSVIPINEIKNFNIELLPIDKQRKIGEIYELYRQRRRLNQIIESKKTEIMAYKLMKAYLREANNGEK